MIISKIKVPRHRVTPKYGDIIISLSANGQQKPIIIDKNNRIIDGYKRLEAMKQLGFEEIDAVYIN